MPRDPDDRPTPALLVSRKAPETVHGYVLLARERLLDVFVDPPSEDTAGTYAIHMESEGHAAALYLDRELAARVAARLAALLAG